ncbi:MAG: putative Hybrid PKS-NRPS biosynthetic cluster [Chaenotheca gracillima]|nr:MAG: putative Hybrid PKS-NRPS biosynthetic cluster [Chaenotheca gracillima]
MASDPTFSRPVPSLSKSKKGTVCFIFSGHGTQWPRMGKVLVEDWPVFRDTVIECDRHLASLPEEDRPTFNLLNDITNPDDLVRVNHVATSQPLCMALQLGLVNLWKSWGVSPSVVTGHSTGEIPAAYAAGLLSLRDAIIIGHYISLYVSREIDRKAEEGHFGTVCAVGLDRADAMKIVDRYEGRVYLAAENARMNCSLSGELDCIKEIEQTCARNRTFCRRLDVKGAYHSPYLRRPAALYREAIIARGIQAKSPCCDMISCVNAEPVTAASCTPEYWENMINSTVNFHSAVATTLRRHKDITAVIDLSPQPVMKAVVLELLQELESPAKYLISSARETKIDSNAQLLSAKSLQALGFDLNISTEDFKRVEENRNQAASARKALNAPEVMRQRPSSETGKLREHLRLVINDAFVDYICRRYGLEPSEVDSTKAASLYGLDSMGAIACRKWLFDELRVDLPLSELLGGTSIDGLVSSVFEKTLTRSTSGDPGLDIPIHHTDLTFRPLSNSQRRLLFLESMVADKTLNNLLAICRITGDFDLPLFHKSWNLLVQRHEVLHSKFVDTPNGPQQIPVQDPYFTLVTVEASELTVEDPVAYLTDLALNYVFQIEDGETLRGWLLHDSQGWRFFLASHHIAWDGTSQSSAFQDILTICQGLKDSQGDPRRLSLPPVPYQFVDYAIWQDAVIKNSAWTKPHIDYWKSQLAGIPACVSLLPISVTSSRPPVKEHKVDKTFFTIRPELATALMAKSKKMSATPFMLLSAAFCSLIYRFTGDRDIVIGSADGDRGHGAFDGLIGFAVNVLAIRCKLPESPSFDDAITAIRDSALGAFEHRALPFDEVLRELGITRSPSHDPVFQIAINYLNEGTHPPIDFGDFCLDDWTQYNVRMQGDMLVEIDQTARGSLNCSIQFDTELYDAQGMSEFARTLMFMLETIADADTEISLDSIPLIPQEDQNFIESALRPAFDGLDEAPSELTLFPDIMTRTASRVPKRPALFHEGSSINFANLETLSNRIAHYLVGKGVKIGDCIGVCTEQNIDMAIAMFGVMKTGAVYCPIAGDLPEDRIISMLEDTGLTMALVDSKIDGKINTLINCGLSGSKIYHVEEIRKINAPSTPPTLQRSIRPSDAIFTIFTSGSTGRPKGLSVRHGSLRYQIKAHMEYVGLSESDRIILASSMVFDMHTIALFGSLMYGCTAYIASSEVRLSPASMIDYVVGNKISSCCITPTQFKAMFAAPNAKRLSDWTSLRAMTLGGEAVTTDILQLFNSLHLPQATLSNAYGPSETTNAVTIMKYSKADEQRQKLFLGGALAPARFFIWDENQNDIPVGFPGELWVGGPTVNPGYMNRPKESSEVFLPDPHATDEERACGWGILYRTGDRFRLSREGTLEFLGRVSGDRQVKIRGIRTELSEIENVIGVVCSEFDEGQESEHRARLAAVAVVLHIPTGKDPTDGKLVAYLTTKGGMLPSNEAQTQIIAYLKVVLKARLPMHMVPAIFEYLTAFPQLPSGKTDYKTLAARSPPDVMAMDDVDDAAAPELTWAQAGVATVWRRVLELGSKHLYPEDGFFLLGGHSLLLLRVQKGIENDLGVVVPVADMFKAQSLEAAARLVEDAVKTSAKPIPRTAKL